MSMPSTVEEPIVAAGCSDVMLPHLYRVETMARETQDTFTLAMQPEAGAGLPAFAPGQFSMLYVFGVGELPISISGDPQDTSKLVYTVRSVGQATQALVSRCRGDVVGVRGPFGTAWPLAEARGKDVLIIAGGIGLAPLRPVIYHVLRHRDEYVRLVVLYGARTPRDLLFRKELVTWSRGVDTQVLTTVDYGGPSWRGRVGVVTTLFRHLRLHPDRTVALICGPEIMMRYVVAELRENRGVPEESIYLSMERNMKCGVGLCGHCQYGPYFICRDGPVFAFNRLRPLLEKYEL
jgi:NAD(P)H-flavin reductase